MYGGGLRARVHDIKVEAVDTCAWGLGRSFVAVQTQTDIQSTKSMLGPRWFLQGQNGDIDVCMAPRACEPHRAQCRALWELLSLPTLQQASAASLCTDLPPLRAGGGGGEACVLSFAATFPRLGSKKNVLTG